RGPVGERLGRILDAPGALEERGAQEEGDAAPHEPVRVEPIDELVDEGRALRVRAHHPVGARHRALDADSGVPVDEALDVVGDVGREGPAGVDDGGIHGNRGHGQLRAPPGGGCQPEGNRGGGREDMLTADRRDLTESTNALFTWYMFNRAIVWTRT